MLGKSDPKNSPFTGKVRVRACGILIHNQKILLLKHMNIGPAGYLWAPPGGGVEFGQDLETTLKREFLEETNLSVEVGSYLFTNEFIDSQHHAIELFFKVHFQKGGLVLGKDPELSSDNQILSEGRFFDFEELERIPKEAIHNAFNSVEKRQKIVDLRGLLTFKY